MEIWKKGIELGHAHPLAVDYYFYEHLGKAQIERGEELLGEETLTAGRAMLEDLKAGSQKGSEPARSAVTMLSRSIETPR
jgi:hypothetical protein